MKSKQQRWAFLSPYLKKYKATILLGLSFVLISTLLDQVTPWVLKDVINRLSCIEEYRGPVEAVTQNCQDFLPSQITLQNLEGFSIRQLIGFPLLIILLVTVISGLLLFFQRFLVINASRKIEYEIRNDLFKKLQSQPKSYMDKHEIGDLMSHATNDLDRIRDLLGPVVLHITRMPCMLLFTLSAVTLLSPKLALVGIVPILILPLFVNKFLNKVHALYSKIQKNL